MTQEDKELLLKDLCARLPYGVKILDIPANAVGDLFLVSTTDTVEYETNDDTGIQTLYNIKPYLFPLSSMTEEQRKELIKLINTGQNDNNEFMRSFCRIEFYHKYHFDYRGLIEKSLALDATNLGIYE